MTDRVPINGFDLVLLRAWKRQNPKGSITLDLQKGVYICNPSPHLHDLDENSQLSLEELISYLIRVLQMNDMTQIMAEAAIAQACGVTSREVMLWRLKLRTPGTSTLVLLARYGADVIGPVWAAKMRAHNPS